MPVFELKNIRPQVLYPSGQLWGEFRASIEPLGEIASLLYQRLCAGFVCAEDFPVALDDLDGICAIGFAGLSSSLAQCVVDPWLAGNVCCKCYGRCGLGCVPLACRDALLDLMDLGTELIKALPVSVEPLSEFVRGAGFSFFFSLVNYRDSLGKHLHRTAQSGEFLLESRF